MLACTHVCSHNCIDVRAPAREKHFQQTADASRGASEALDIMAPSEMLEKCQPRRFNEKLRLLVDNWILLGMAIN